MQNLLETFRSNIADKKRYIFMIKDQYAITKLIKFYNANNYD